jgi:hypothetical protein
MKTGSRTRHDVTVRELAERLPALPAQAPMSAIAAACLAEDAHDWIVLLDERDRPVRLVDRRALLIGRPFEHPVSGIAADCTLAAAVRRIGTLPLVVQDSHGCYAGVVRTERLLSALAG